MYHPRPLGKKNKYTKGRWGDLIQIDAVKKKEIAT